MTERRNLSVKEANLLDDASKNLNWAMWMDIFTDGVKGLPDIPRTKEDDKLRRKMVEAMDGEEIDEKLMIAKKKLDKLIELRKRRRK